MSNTISNSALTSLMAHAKKHQPLDPNDELTHNAQELVSQSFYGTMLKQAQKSPFHSQEFEGGRGGEAYQEMLNQNLAQHMSRGAGSKLVRPLVHKLQAGRAYQKHKGGHKANHHAKGFGSLPKSSGLTSKFLGRFVGAS